MKKPNLRKHFNLPGSPRIAPVIFSAILLLGTVNYTFGQYLHTQGTQIVDGDGREVILRGMGLGGWMLQEGYMLEMNSFANPQHQIRARIQDLIGESNTNEFYGAWLANHCTKRDIDSLASWGFNSVRLPMHYNLFTLPVEKEPVAGQHTWLEKGFVMVDNLLQWCAANRIYLILDLHAAPGGQGNDAAISDYDNSKPSLWQSEENKQKTIALWRKLAERYASEKWIGGYDLINETNWNFTANANKNGCDETTNAPLRKLLMDITAAIRQADQHHIIYIEGNCWANNHNGLWPAWDNNLVLSFHKYWNYNDQGSVQGMINLRNQHNVPLWLGESGENSNTWFTNAISLMESNKIGWAWWPMKKVGSVVNPLTVVKNEGFEQLLNYWKNGGTKPSVEVARNALMQLAENLKIENNIYRKDVIDAMFRQVQDANTTIPFKKHTAPGIVHASDYDLGRVNKAYYDTDTANYQVSAGSYTAWNSGWSYRNDGVDIQPSTDTDANASGYNIGWTADREWTQYTVNVDSSAAYEVTVRYAAAAGGSKIKLMVDGTDKSAVIELPASGGNQTWAAKVIPDVVLYKGMRKVRLVFEKGGANIGYLKFALGKKTGDTPLKAVSARTSPGGAGIALSLNKKIAPATVSNTGFSVAVNDVAANITAVAGNNDSQLTLTVDKPLSDADAIKVSYNSDAIKSVDGTLLEDFSDLPVTNTLPLHIAIPGKVEAEDFIVNQGLQLETTTDTGGGQNIGYTNAGDYLDYRIRVTQAGEYGVELRIASAGQAGKIEIQQLDGAQHVVNNTTVDVPVTGGWQTWRTVNAKITFTAGEGTLRLRIVQPEFNLNWVRFSAAVISGTEKSRQGSLHIYPNPAQKLLNIDLPGNFHREDSTLSIIGLNGSVVKHQPVSNSDHSQELYVGDLEAGIYIVRLESKNNVWSKKIFIE